jgi:chloramphenicol O-acetyltransferase type B
VIHRIKWIFKSLPLKKKHIHRHWLSYADDRSVLEGHNYLAQRSKVIMSKLGLFSYINFDSVLSHAEIGRYSCIGPETWVGGIGKHPTDRKSTHRMFYSDNNLAWHGFAYTKNFTEIQKTVIGNDVWIGARCTVLDGVKIGDGAIVATGSVVVKDVEAYAIVGGVPAKLIRKRFNPASIEKLLIERWWDKTEQEIRSMALAGEFSGTYDREMK